jgi:hypothetical protein
VISLGGGLSFGTWENYSRYEEVTATTEQERDVVPGVRVATVEPSPGTMSVTLPGTSAAFAAANVYARATGYIAKRNVDIGDIGPRMRALCSTPHRPRQRSPRSAAAMRANDETFVDSD